MMKLSAVKRVAETIDSEWKSPVAETILARWKYDKGTLFFYRVSSNFVFVFRKDGERHFLRFIETTERDVITIKSEIGVLTYLNSHMKDVVNPVESVNGEYVEEVETQWGTFAAVVFKGIEGESYEVEVLNENQFEHWGASLGKLHQTLKSIPEDLIKTRSDWNDLLGFVRNNLSDREVAASDELNLVNKWFHGMPVTRENFGLIHFDFELDNLKFKGEKVGIYDFDDCIRCWYAGDIAFALRDLFQNGIDLSSKSFIAFMRGYKQETNVDQEMLNNLQWFIRLHNLITFAKLVHAVDLEQSTTYPEWLQALPDKLMKKIEDYRVIFNERLSI